MTDDKRLIEDYLPIVAISAEASREKSVRKGHISTLHLWWARRPLVACRAAVYGALVPASQFVPNAGSDEQKKSLGRANAAKFVERLCQYPGNPAVIAEAQRHILEAHAERLTRELREVLGVRRQAERDAALTDAHSLPDGPKAPSPLRSVSAVHEAPAWCLESNWPADKTIVTVEDILAGRAPRPRVLDMFAGGGAIPLEALRLGCEAHALDLNPVAHILQLCTLVYPQKYGNADPAARGMTGPKNAKGQATWGGLADEVRYWGKRVLEKVRNEIGDLYPPVPDPELRPRKKDEQSTGDDPFAEPQHVMAFAADRQQRLEPRTGLLTPVAYLWTRTVKCKNPGCTATVPLVKQTWLCKKEGRYAALKVVACKGEKRVRFEVVEAKTATGLGFDPEAFSKGGNADCPFCGTVADSDYVKLEGLGRRMGIQPIAVACTRPGKQGKVYLSVDQVPPAPYDASIMKAVEALCKSAGITIPNEPVVDDAKNSFWIRLYGVTTYGQLFTPRQLLTLLTFAATVRTALNDSPEISPEHAKATITCLALMVNKLADFDSTQCTWNYTGGRGVGHSFTRQALPMAWDFAETHPFNPAGASWVAILEDIPAAIDVLATVNLPGKVARGSATALVHPSGYFDAVVTDPPYYDNVSYADLSDFFYVWLKRSAGHLYPEHFSGQGTPKKNEAVSDATRHNGDQELAKIAYEDMMSRALAEAVRVLKPGGIITIVYAHKTTLGWSTLVDALRRSGCEIVEAWPLDTERGARMIAMGTAALASSIFLIARKRDGTVTGAYDEGVRAELETIVRERVATLWDMGISGADLVIACVGAGLRAFTRFARVEYANGEEVPAERFLTEVETVVLETILARLSKEVGGTGTSLAGLDAATRFYVLWRYTYSTAELDAGEAIIFANGTHVELDAQHSLTSGTHALVTKRKGKYVLRDFSERGAGAHLGLSSENGQPAPLVDVLHRTLWLMEKRPTELPAFLRDSQVNREQLRLVAQALAGPALKGGELGDVSPTAELSALGKITANWQSVVEDAALTTGEKEERKKGQKQLI